MEVKRVKTGGDLKGTKGRGWSGQKVRKSQKRRRRFQQLKYLDILHKNKNEKNKTILRSANSVFRVLHNKVSRYCVILGFKRSGIRIENGLKYKGAQFRVLKSVNAVITKLDDSKIQVKLRQRYEEGLAEKENLRYFLRRNFLPCNGQRTRTNARTCKNKRLKTKK